MITLTFGDELHIHVVEWTPESIRFYVDEKRHHEFDINVVDKELNPFHKPHYLIMNLAVGGAWAGEPG
ncbi:family 16 glycosylhydrolase [Vibrio astriarenae]|uniref:Family 16 glycosylhydrolase n=1 Tax=Vibrio astriarenae TaxID=1481923 RepID=A0A7Z2YG98_9VIBR|nr:family 16 glycosylhydrolase [Vibrio astriarenae]QIA65989.1 family 16 glycosylhydrolase [Vibrio astriarenae]